MAFMDIQGVEIKGVSACTPKFKEEILTSPSADNAKLAETTGIFNLRKSSPSTTTSDLCYNAAIKLLNDLSWDASSVDCLIFVTQTPDYILPATSCILQDRLGLSNECYALDISLGCSGWVYGLSSISSIMKGGGYKRGLLLVGDTISKVCSPEDRSTAPLFGDAGTATALELNPSSIGLKFHLATDGSGFESIIIKDGGFRTQTNLSSLVRTTNGEGLSRSRLELELDGMNVFSFGISRAPESVMKLINHYGIDKEVIDVFFFHQANRFMNEKIRKKLVLPIEKVPYSLKDFGNTSSATIPLTMVTEWGVRFRDTKQKVAACAFGVGLSWASCYFETDRIVCSELVEI